jgi:hypothetical protein
LLPPPLELDPEAPEPPGTPTFVGPDPVPLVITPPVVGDIVVLESMPVPVEDPVIGG